MRILAHNTVSIQTVKLEIITLRSFHIESHRVQLALYPGQGGGGGSGGYPMLDGMPYTHLCLGTINISQPLTDMFQG